MHTLARLLSPRSGATLLLGLLLLAAYGLLALWVGHVAGLTPSPHDLLNRPDAWTDKHYPNVAVGYLWTALILVGATECCSVAISGVRRVRLGRDRVWTNPLRRVQAFVAISVRKARLRGARRALLRRLPKHAVCAEVGVWKGDGAAAILRHTRPRKLILLDPWEHQPQYDRALFGGRAGTQAAMDAVHAGVARRFDREIKAGAVEIVRARSQDAESALGGRQLDWAWIDGDHTFEAVKDDLERFSRLVRPGGCLAGDDYVLGWWGNGVIKAVDEFVAEGRGSLQRFGHQHFLIQLTGD